MNEIKKQKMVWIITAGWAAGPEVPDLKVEAKNYDEAIAKAREVNPLYCGGHVANKGEI